MRNRIMRLCCSCCAGSETDSFISIDQCEHCGASYREDCLARDAAKNDEDDKEHDYNDDGDIDGDNDNDDNTTERQNNDSATNGVEVLNGPGGSQEGSFLGYCYPEMDELEGKAVWTEIYHCHSCNSYTRFPRYNAVKQIVESRGRGRSGEYSILLYRILRSLRHSFGSL
mmetsp:Transcript_4173/g.6364  ORF Transcript_4173/g.6364 Transcript_4173/m.6364 type:complete len:170 (+) Transcript_4173:2286-2795(+)